MIAGIVLAAGAGQRIGRPKALLATSTSGETFVQRACGVLRAGGVDDIIVVVSPAIAARVRELEPAARVLVNDDPARGQLSSLQLALAELPEAAEAAAVLPVDVPLVAPATVRALVQRWVSKRLRVVRPTNGERHGHPVIFDRVVFPELAAAPLSAGARLIVRRYATAAGDMFTPDEGAFTDIDTVEDYRAAFGRLP